jgi:hypothetical protein
MAGLYLKVVIWNGLEAVALGLLMRGLCWQKEKVDAMLVDVRRCLIEGGVHSYLSFQVVYGEKSFR